MSDFVHRLDTMKSGIGDLFLGPANTVIANLSTANRATLKHVGSIANGGFDYEFRHEDYLHETGRPTDLAKMEPQKRGINLKFAFKEVFGPDTLLKAFGEGSKSISSANASQMITAQQFTIYGYNECQLPFHHLSEINPISDDSPTPITWDPAGIDQNWDVNLVKAKIKARVGGDVVTDTEGANFSFNGTWSKPEEKIVSAGNGSVEEKPYYSVYFRAPKEDGRFQQVFIPKAYFTAPETVKYANGEERIIGITLMSAKDPTQFYQWYIYEENAT